jgi:hypothetical protein
MTDTGDPTWYESLLQKQQETNVKLASLCGKQQELIKHLEIALEEKGVNEPLAAPESSSSSNSSTGGTDGQVTLGPSSPRLKWTGTTTDLISVSVSGNHYQALVLTSGMIREWNKVLDISRKMRKYIKERDISVSSANWAYDVHKNGQLENTPQGQKVEGRLVSDLKASWEFHYNRTEKLEDLLLACDTDIAHGREHLEHKIRVIFKRHGLLRPLDNGWLQDLRDGRDEASKERAKLKDSTSIETPDCDSGHDLDF